MTALNIIGSGMVTPVGFDAAASCAAIRVGIDRFRETRFMFDGDWVRGAFVSYRPVLEGRAKLLEMLVKATDEALEAAPPAARADTALFVCLPEHQRPGRPGGLDDGFAREAAARVKQRARLRSDLSVFETGTLGGINALLKIQELFQRSKAHYAVLAGVDSFLTARTLGHFHRQRRLLTADNSDGFLPGEAAAALLLSSRPEKDSLQCLGIGRGQEPATLDSDKPLRSEGLLQAFRNALRMAGCGFEQLDYRLSDIAGEQYSFKDAATALTRAMRTRKEALDLWHPSDCVGRVDAAAVPFVLGVALAAARKRYAPGPGALCHFSDDAGGRAAVILREGRRPS